MTKPDYRYMPSLMLHEQWTRDDTAEPSSWVSTRGVANAIRQISVTRYVTHAPRPQPVALDPVLEELSAFVTKLGQPGHQLVSDETMRLAEEVAQARNSAPKTNDADWIKGLAMEILGE